MRESDIDTLSADGAQEVHPAPYRFSKDFDAYPPAAHLADSAEALRDALSLAVSMIRSGEPMSKQTEQVFEEAFQAPAPSLSCPRCGKPWGSVQVGPESVAPYCWDCDRPQALAESDPSPAAEAAEPAPLDDEQMAQNLAIAMIGAGNPSQYRFPIDHARAIVKVLHEQQARLAAGRSDR